jgi:hypothetical protein
MKLNKIFLKGLITLTVLFAVNISAQQEASLSQGTILEIQDRVNAMGSLQLNERKANLMAEAEELQAETSSSQSPARLKTISSRLNEIFVELGIIQKALVIVGSAGILGAVLDDGYKDSTPPLITLNGSNPLTIELGSTFTDPGASADTGESVSASGSVDTFTVGVYIITYTAIDDWGNIGTTSRAVNVVDTTAPVVTVSGANPATVELGTTYTDAVATASD